MKRIALLVSLAVLSGLAPAAAAKTSPGLAELLGVPTVDPHDTTLALRDLRMRMPSLPPAQRLAAERMFARPTDGGSDPDGQGYPDLAAWTYSCFTRLCVHWVTTGADAPDLTDTDADTIPDYVETVATTMDDVWTTEVETFGFRPPKSDAGAITNASGNPNSLFDVYLADIGDDSIYGYCNSDDAILANPDRGDVSAYCVLDDDYSASQFGANTPLGNLRVTAAHEFFHAVQFAYDYFEDAWLLESTASWIEDEIYDNVNDNVAYLSSGPMGYPGLPLDYGAGMHRYGTWIWWRFVTDTVGVAKGREIVKSVFEYADASPVGPDLTSAQAMAVALDAAKVHFPRVLAMFGLANTGPSAWYTEGSLYISSPFGVTGAVSPSRRSQKKVVAVDHLSTKTVRINRSGTFPSSARLSITVDGPARSTDPAVVVWIRLNNGSSQAVALTQNTAGDGSIKLAPALRNISSVVVGIANASVSYQCWQGTQFACAGIPRQDDLVTTVTAKVV